MFFISFRWMILIMIPMVVMVYRSDMRLRIAG